MKLEEIIKLIDAGYTKEDIQAMDAPELEAEPEPETPEAPAAPAESAELQAIRQDLADLKKGLYALNVMNSSQPEKKTADDVLKAALSGGKEA